MILLVALGSSPLEVFALPNNGLTEWPKGGYNDVKTDLPKPPAVENIVDLSGMFNYPTLDYGGLSLQYQNRKSELDVIKSLKGYVPKDDDSSVAVITRDAPWQAGVMWSKESNKINLAEPFHMVSYVYLGIRGQAERNADGNRAGADGITFTMHNDYKSPVASESGSKTNTGINAYGALGNGLGVYGNNFSANTGSEINNMAYMTKGVTNGIALEFDTFYNHNNTTQHSDNDLWQFVGNEGSSNSNLGHIGINYLNELQNNNANNDGKQFGYRSDQVIKHNTMLAVGWDGGISGLDSQNGWQVSNQPRQKLADNMWHRLEVKWTPKSNKTGDLTYIIYRQGHSGNRNVSSIYDTSNDTKSSNDILTYTISDLNVVDVFKVNSTADSVYWGFSGSTGYYQNNQAVQMLQLPAPYYKSGIRKVDQDGKLVKNAKFQLQVLNGETWQPVVFQKAVGSETQDYVLTGVDNGLIGVTTDLEETSPTYGKVTATQLPKGTYRWFEIEAPEGYQKNQEYYPSETGFVVNYQYPTVTTKAENKKLYQLYQVSLEKKASDTDAALRGAVFSLQKKVDQNWETVSQDGVSEFTTNSEGKISIPNLEAGTYRWEEKKAPTGYKSDQQYYPKEEGFEVAYHDGLKIDPSNQNYLFEATTATNPPRDFELTLEKLSSTFQKSLQGVEFKLYDSAGGTDFSILTPKAIVTTDADGKIVLNKEQIQADKTYYLVESQTVDGFIQLKGYFTITTDKFKGFTVTYTKADSEADANPFVFTSTSTDTSYAGTLKIYNKRKSILPTTGGNGILGYVGIGLTMAIVALLFFIARKRIFKWLIILIVATSGLAGLAGDTQVVSAQEQEQVQLEVNRLVYQPSDTQHKSGVPVAGAKLEVVDVTKSFYELVNRQKLSLKEAQEAVSKSNKIDGQSLAVATTDQSGLVRFTVSKTSQQRPAVYLIRELVTPVAVTKMENMVVVLPILDESGNEKSLISLFPKSHGIFTFDKTIDEKQSSYSFGKPIPYRLSTIIPEDMTNLSSYEIEDIYDQGLRFISESLEIFIDGEKQSDSIKAVSLSENKFRVVFDVAKLADFGGKKLEVTYQMVIKDTAAIDQDLVNTATLYPGDLTPLVDRENVQTGGFRFIKRAAEGKQNPLAKATFVIKNPTDDTVLTYKEGKYQFEKVATNASGVVRLTSDDDGYFEIRGLRYGEYLACEIRAPSGYVLQDKPTAFTVGVSTYSQGPVLSIFNVKKPKIRLPETGTVVTSTAFVGLLIMASSLVMIRKRKDN